jgi:hypothetical protein
VLDVVIRRVAGVKARKPAVIERVEIAKRLVDRRYRATRKEPGENLADFPVDGVRIRHVDVIGHVEVVAWNV